MLGKRPYEIQILPNSINDWLQFFFLLKNLNFNEIYGNNQIARKNIFRFMLAKNEPLNPHNFALIFFGVVSKKLIMISRVNFRHQNIHVRIYHFSFGIPENFRSCGCDISDISKFRLNLIKFL